MINTLKLSNLLFNKILIAEQFFNFMIWQYSTIIQNNTHPLTQN